MAVYYVVENEQSVGYTEPLRTVEYEGKEVKMLERPKTAKVVKVETSATLAQVQQAYNTQLYPGNATGTPAVITEAQYKFS